ncbi:MAG: FecR domain-containing protein [Candidatus Omnitrophota bacterium]
MKKIFTFLFVFVFIISNAAAFAQMPVTVPGMGSSLEGLSRIGVVAGIQGKVEVMTPGAAGRVVQSGEEIFIGDEVKTDALGHLQILLLDETVFTIGPNSAITIDKFIYDPGTHVGKMEASVAKGVFRYVSGKIAANKPENVKIHLPSATIGIRGTIVAGEVSSTGSMAMLLGPGTKNETGATIGSFVMTGTGGNSGQQEHVNRTGFGVSVDTTGSLSGVFMVPETRVQHLGGALLPSAVQVPAPPTGGNDVAPAGGGMPPRPAGPIPGTLPVAPAPGAGPATAGPVPMTTGGLFGSGDMGKISGEQTYAGFQTTQTAQMMGIFQNNLMQDSTIASQDAMNSSVQPKPQTVRNTLNGDMLARVAGVVNYHHVGGSFNYNGLLGTLSATLNVDYNLNQIIGGSVQINIPDGISAGTPLIDKCDLSVKNFMTGDPSGFASYEWTGAQLTQGGPTSFDGLGAFDKVTVEFQDVMRPLPDGSTQVDISAQAKVTADYTRSTDTGSGELIAQ